MRLLAALMIFLCIPVAWAGQTYTPKLDIGKGGQCVEDPQSMRKNHMHRLKHQRDETVHKGIRDDKYSLKNCIECHASTRDDSVIGRADSFCEGCHRYEAVKIDCFECHSSKRKTVLGKRE
ncbi:MAG: Hdr-like menaquinol oxidoreductase cytochrome c subunit [Nitrosomonadales bacterium]|nr:Hdr-like menaquinol oxidoreductase cytochrome c subunit [Nitrosomonadales bacterium]